MEAGRYSFDKKLNDQTCGWEEYLGDIVLQAIKLRKEKKISRQVLAYTAGVNEGEVDDFENFRYEKVSLESFAKILCAVGLRFDYERN